MIQPRNIVIVGDTVRMHALAAFLQELGYHKITLVTNDNHTNIMQESVICIYEKEHQSSPLIQSLVQRALESHVISVPPFSYESFVKELEKYLKSIYLSKEQTTLKQNVLQQLLQNNEVNFGVCITKDFRFFNPLYKEKIRMITDYCFSRKAKLNTTYILSYSLYKDNLST